LTIFLQLEDEFVWTMFFVSVFVSKFAAMSHDGDLVPERRAALRTSGLLGLQGVLRKTVTDDLQVKDISCYFVSFLFDF